MKYRSSESPSRWMALDVGSKTIGVALSDPLKLMSGPLTTVRRSNLEADLQAIREIAAEYNVDKCIIGRPRHMDGRPAALLSAIEPLAEQLEAGTGLTVEWYDERLSTREAEQAMSRLGLPIRERRRRRNEFAAAIILKWYLDEFGAS